MLLAALAAAGCRTAPEPPDYDAQLPPGQYALRKLTDPLQIPDLTDACVDTRGLAVAVKRSLNYLGKPSSKTHFPCGTVTHADAVASLKAFSEMLNSGLTPAELNAVIRARFDIYVSVGCDGRGTVLFTGYYTPIFNASLKRTAEFIHPLYKMPPGLTKLPDGRPARAMPDRRTIESGDLYQGNELAWLADPFEAYVCHVQGSSRLKLPDGRQVTVGYAANNGHPYRSVRAELVKDGKIGQRAGLPTMINYFRAHPEAVKKYTWRNPRYVFFDLIADGSPRGSLNEPVTPMRTIATDKRIFPRACLTFISTKLPFVFRGRIVDLPYHGFALDQDAGGAIRAPGRCDVYIGLGQQAGELAGRAQNEGRLYYLLLKEK